MTRTDGLLLLAAVALGVAAFMVARAPKSQGASMGASLLPVAGTSAIAFNGITGGDAISAFLSLPDPTTVPLGTRSGNYVLSQSRVQGAAPYWSFQTGGYTGGAPVVIQ